MNVRLMLKIYKRGEKYMKKQQQTRVRLKASVKEMLKQNPMRAININLFQQPLTYREHLFMQTLKIWMT